MAIVVPIVSTWDPKGVDRAKADISKAEGGFSKAGAGAKAAFLPAVGVLGGLAAAFKVTTAAGEESRQAQAKLANVMKQMGHEGATERLLDYSGALQDTLGVSDESVNAVQTMLGTFGELTKSVDESGGAFDRATQAAFDLASAGFGTAEGNAAQLGKALNDPIKGLASLAKSGVTFTDEEKDRIKTLVESNKMGEAQAVVLEAIEKQVGGTAAASATGSDKMALAFGDITEAIGVGLLPAFDALSAVAIKFANFARDNAGVIIAFSAVIGGLAAAVVAVNVAMKVYAAYQKIAAAATWLWNSALLANPIVLVVVAIVALIAILVIAYKKVDWFRAAVDKAWKVIKAGLGVLMAGVKAYFNVWKTILQGAWTVVKWLWDKLKTAWSGIKQGFQLVGDKIGTITDGIKSAWQSVWDFIKPIFDKIAGLWSKVSGWIGKIPGVGSSSVSTFAVPTVETSTRAAGTAAVARQTGGTSITINGAIDPESTARAVTGLLAGHSSRQGRAAGTPRRLTW